MTKTKSKKTGARKQTVERSRDGEISAASKPVVAIAIVPEKVGEERGNLAHRANWFATRSGRKN